MSSLIDGVMQGRATKGCGPARTVAAYVLVTLGVGAAGQARADQIITTDENFRRVDITGFEQGFVQFRTPDRRRHEVCITEVRRLVVSDDTTLKDFNAAEEYVARGAPEQALPRYVRALRVAERFWPDVVQVRLLQARDQAGRFEEAVDDFVSVAERMPNVAAELIPQSVPRGANAETRRALESIDAALGRHPEPVVEAALLLCRYAVCRRVDLAEARRMAPSIATLPLPRGAGMSGGAVWHLQMNAMDLLVESRQYEPVLAGVDGVIPDAPEAMLPGFLLLKGRALYGQATDRSGYARSCWAFMRVVIHHADDPRVGEALVWAARAHEKIERPSKAAQLLRECLARSDLTDDVRREAQQMFDRLTVHANEG